MPPIPDADVALSPDLVSRLLADQCPDLAELPVAPFAHGWDNESFLLGDQLLVRLPRRSVAAPALVHEQAWLPRLAPELSVDVPVPVFAGLPGSGYPYPWSIVPLLSGRVMATVPVAERSRAAAGLAAFFGDLHRLAPPDAPSNPVRGVPLSAVAERWLPRLERLPGFGRPAVAAWTGWASVPAHDGPPRWVHGDCHPLNLLIGDRGELAGVLDWSDLTAGDPACDLASAWLAFDRSGRDEFERRIAAFGLYDRHAWTRAKAWALGLAAIFCDADDPTLATEGRRALAQLLPADA